MCIVLFLNSFKQMEFERDALLGRKMKKKSCLLKCISILEQQGEMECTDILVLGSLYVKA